MTEYDDSRFRVQLADAPRRLDALVAAARGHADVGDDHVRPLGFDGGEQRLEIAAGRDDLDFPMALEQAANALA